MVFVSFPFWLAVVFCVLSLLAFGASLVAIQVTKQHRWGQSCPLLSAGLSFAYFFLNLDVAVLSLDSQGFTESQVRHYAWYAVQLGSLILIYFATRGSFRTGEVKQAIRQFKNDAVHKTLKPNSDD